MLRLLASLLICTFFTILLGAWVRLEGAGLSCPDWPLCHGKIIPPMEYRIMLEYFHRLAAMLTSILLVLCTIFVFIKPQLRKLFKTHVLLALFLLISQIIFGALTVTQLLKWEVVTIHLGIGILFFSTIFLWFLAVYRMKYPFKKLENRSKNLIWLLGLGVGMTYIQILLGGSVSSNYAALACPDFPTCYGEWFPRISGSVGIQFIHRLGALILTIFLFFLSWKWISFFKKEDTFFYLLPSFIIFCLLMQWFLGIAMIYLGVGNDMTVPVVFSVAHLAFASLLFLSILTMYYNVHFRRKT